MLFRVPEVWSILLTSRNVNRLWESLNLERKSRRYVGKAWQTYSTKHLKNRVRCGCRSRQCSSKSRSPTMMTRAGYLRKFKTGHCVFESRPLRSKRAIPMLSCYRGSLRAECCRHPRVTASPLSREVLAVLHGEPRRMGHKRPQPSFETPRKRAAPQDDGSMCG